MLERRHLAQRLTHRLGARVIATAGAIVAIAACGKRDAPAARADSAHVAPSAPAAAESRAVPPHYRILTDSLGITPDRIREVRSPTRMRIEVDYVVPAPAPDTAVMIERAMRTGILLAKHGQAGDPPADRVTVRVWQAGKTDAPLRTFNYKGGDLRAMDSLPTPHRGW